MRRRAALAAAGSALLLAPLTTRAEAPAWDEVLRAGALRIGVIRARPPYFWQEDGEWVGFSAQMGRDLAQALGSAMGTPIETRFVETTWPTVVLDLQAGRIDAFFGLTYTGARAQALSLFGPLYALPEVALDAAGFDPGPGWDAYDRPEVTVSVVMGTTDEIAARARLPHATLRSMKATEEAVLDLQSGHARTMITSLLVGLGAVRSLHDTVALHVPQPLFTQPSYGGTRRDGDDRLARFFQGWAQAYRADGRSKAAIIAAMRRYGLDVDHLPDGMAF